MCESSAYMITPEGETKIMDYVVDIVPNDDGSLTLSDLLGGTKIVQGKLKEVKLLNHKIIIEGTTVQSMNIVVLDGMGGGIGSRIVGILKDEIPPYIEIYGLGTNALATAAMLKKGANKGATGENAIAVTVKKADFIIGSIAMTIPNSMMGEVTPKMVEAIGNSDGLKIYIPILPENHHIVSLEEKPLLLQIREAVSLIKKELNLGEVQMDARLNMDKEADIFKVLLAHWINHTGDHIEGYREWAEKLKGTSKDQVSQEIFLAIDKMREAQKKIMEAKLRF